MGVCSAETWMTPWSSSSSMRRSRSRWTGAE
uniref:Uncharacterized protein n=1 Tax=Anguilla anguilla TaxID=7936 RepID=A0A0E9VM13_ANGAN